MITKLEEQIVDSLCDEFVVTKVSRHSDKNCLTYLKIFFTKNREEGYFTYYLSDGEAQCCDYTEQADEDIYGEFHDWVEEHIDYSETIKFDGRVVDYAY